MYVGQRASERAKEGVGREVLVGFWAQEERCNQSELAEGREEKSRALRKSVCASVCVVRGADAPVTARLCIKNSNG